MKSSHHEHENSDIDEEVERTLREDEQEGELAHEAELRKAETEQKEFEETARDAWDQGPGQDPMIAAHL